jgi:hypothetical protein
VGQKADFLASDEDKVLVKDYFDLPLNSHTQTGIKEFRLKT